MVSDISPVAFPESFLTLSFFGNCDFETNEATECFELLDRLLFLTQIRSIHWLLSHAVERMDNVTVFFQGQKCFCACGNEWGNVRRFASIEWY
jgi:hypothetical protein